MELFVRGVHAVRRSALWWGLGIAAFAVVTVVFWPGLEDTDALESLGDMSEDVLAAFGAQDIATPAGYLDGQMFALMLPLLMSGMAIAMATALTAGDEDAGRLELLHALPIGRRAVWLSRLAAVVAVVLLVAAALTTLMAVSLDPFSLEEIGVGQVAAATFACAALAIFHAAVGYAVAGFGGSRGLSIGVAVLVLMGGYLASFLLPLADALAGVRKASPWFWAIGEQPVSDGVDPGWLLLLAAVTVALVAAGTFALERRDIRSA